MSISSALYTGVSGLINNGEAMNVIGNNLSNVNTIGFKGGRTLFSDMLSASVGNSSQIGRGVQMQKVENLFTQSGFQNSENVTDLAIQGNSFFALKDPNIAGAVSQNVAFLSRAGSFHVDSGLNLVNPDGYQVVDTEGNAIKFTDNAANITTSTATLKGYLQTMQTSMDKALTAVTTLIGTITSDMAATPTAKATAAQLAIANSIKNNITAAQTALATAVANPNASTAADALTAATAVNSVITSSNTTSAFTDSTGTYAGYTTFRTAYDGASGAFDSTDTKKSFTAQTTNVNTSVTDLSAQIGLAFSKIVKVEPNGLITYLGKDGVTTNYYKTSGQPGVASTPANAGTVQRLAVVTVPDLSTLEKMGGTLYRPTSTSGVPASSFTLAGNSPNGTSEKVLSNSLEMSNVDMASEFVKMITTQRAYSANSKTITTTDEMMQEALSLKR